MVAETPEVPPRTDPAMQRRVVVSSFVGSLIEWFDFYLYGVATALVFDRLFFPEFSASTGIIASFGTFTVGYAARPIGGILYGHFGDRLGRKKMLVSSVLLMGLATVAVGLMPTYAQIGIWAPLLLVAARILQGISAGGEWGGAVLMSMEHSARERRGLWSSVTMAGNPCGVTLATGAFALVQLLPEDQFLSWGWRLPFLASAVLVVVALWIRLGVEESPVFQAALRAEQPADRRRAPILELMTTQPLATVMGILVVAGPFTFGTVYVSFGVTYAAAVGFSKATATNALLAASFLGIVAVVAMGALSDRVDRQRQYIVGVFLLCLVSFVAFWMMNTLSVVLLVASFCLMKVTHAVSYGPMGAFLAELFTTRTSYTGISLGYQVGGVIGGAGPLVASLLLAMGGGGAHSVLISSYLAAACALSAVAALVAHRRIGRVPDALAASAQQ